MQVKTLSWAASHTAQAAGGREHFLPLEGARRPPREAARRAQMGAAGFRGLRGAQCLLTAHSPALASRQPSRSGPLWPTRLRPFCDHNRRAVVPDSLLLGHLLLAALRVTLWAFLMGLIPGLHTGAVGPSA